MYEDEAKYIISNRYFYWWKAWIAGYTLSQLLLGP